jgi:hypothetical protein
VYDGAHRRPAHSGERAETMERRRLAPRARGKIQLRPLSLIWKSERPGTASSFPSLAAQLSESVCAALVQMHEPVGAAAKHDERRNSPQ